MAPALRCPSCGSPAAEGTDTCPSCSAALPWQDGEPDPDLTRLSDAADARRPVGRPKSGHPARTPRTLTSSSWLSATDAINHGRFEPGAILDDRYRIIGRLGKGGMGEVYRADDLRLGQPVALKFLPESVDRDPVRLTQLHTEVRMARQVSHPNVCRVYDAGEFEGHTFLSMEYVDGEDLSSLLRRIGRFPTDRAIELARQICAGLAAAHDRGVVHRDLKPANIMLDGAGKIRITDFGLAGATGEVLRAGTPAYMAPEQLSGGEVTPRSDIYALGLVLYELFTGQRALDAPTMAELIVKREQGEITPPTDIVRDLDPSIERVILRCLDPEPARRPGSALAVAAALPGGDPLAAALAAGETPSPEMVAAAGSTAAQATWRTVATSAWVILSSLVILLLYQRVLLVNRAPLPKPPAALIDRAQEIVQKLGYGERVRSTAAGFATDLDWARFIDRTTPAPGRWASLATGRPPTYVLWYRTSPSLLRPIGNHLPLTGLNPPMNVSGMTMVVVDTFGRLAELLAVPEPIQPADAARPHPDWNVLFEAAGLRIDAFTPVPPRWAPVVYADERMAWEGRLPGLPDQTVRVEAAAAAGRPVSFGITGPWTVSARTPGTGTVPFFNRVLGVLSALIMPGLMIVGAVLARRNVKLGRGDRRGAFRAAAAAFAFLLAGWILGDTHIGSFDAEIQRLFDNIGAALFSAALVWLTYLGLEPYVRRFSPDSLIGWTRLIAGGWRDPRVGRDVLIGVAAGLAMTVAYAVHDLIPPLLGRPEPLPIPVDPNVYLSINRAFATLFNQAHNALTSGMLGIGGFVAFRILLKRRSAAALAAIVCFAPVVINGMFTPGMPLLDLALGGVIVTIFVLVIGWIGLLATMATLFTHFLLLRAPLTTDLTSWRGTTAMVILFAVTGLGLGGAAIAAGRLQHRGATPRLR